MLHDIPPETLAQVEFTPDDVAYIIQMLDRIASFDGARLREALEDFAMSVEITLEELDLEALAQSMFGVTDPIGQLMSWLYDRLKEFSSWVTSAVDALIDELWSNYISPGLSAISGAVSWIRTVVDNISATLSTMVDTLSDVAETIAGIPGAITDAFTSFTATIQNTLAGITTTISNIVSGIIDAITPALSAISGGISTIITTLSSITAQIVNAIRAIPDALKPFFNSIVNAISGIQSALAGVLGAIQALPESILGGVKGIIDTLWSGLQSAFGSLANALSAIQGAFGSLAKSITEGLGAITGAIDYLRGYLEGLFRAFGDAVTGALKAVQDAFTSAMQTVSNWMQQASAALQGFVNGILKFPEWFPRWFYDNIAKPISDALAGLAQAIWNMLPDWLKDAIIGLRQAWDSFVKGLQDFLKNPLEYIQRGFSWLADQIWKLLPDWLRGAIQALQSAWTALILGLQDFLKDPIGFIRARLEELSKWIWDHLPDPIKGAWEKIKDFLESAWKWLTEDLPGFINWLWEGLQEFVSDPWKWLREHVVEPALGALQWMIERLRGAVDWVLNAMGGVMNAIGGALSWLAQALGGALSMVVGALRGLAVTVADALAGVAKWIGDTVRGYMESLIRPVNEYVASTLGKLIKGEGGEMEFTVGLITTMSISLLPLFFLSDMMRGISKLIDWVTPRLAVRIAPFNLGADLAVDVGVKLASVLETLAERLKHAPEKFLESFITAIAFASLWPMQYVIGYAWRSTLWSVKAGDMMWRLPSETEVRELARRMLPQLYEFKMTLPESKILGIKYDFGTLMEYARTFMAMGGLPLSYIELALAPEEEFHVLVKDRFRTDRRIPLSLLYQIPSASDIAAMAVRDIFPRYEDFAAAFAARGMTPDIAALYFLFRFKYPPPGQLAQFYWRGIAKVLWSPGLPKDKEMVEDLQKKLRVGYAPTAPKDLNEEPETLNRMMATYMKWHDYFPLAWDEGFPADIDIIHDLMADIPTKIDIRWMVRWALLEQLSKVGFTMDTSIEELVDKMKACKGDELLAQKVSPGITMDVSVMARLIEATGMHPYWVPLVAVAEAINALADEKTLIRTGFINAYKEGLITLDNSEQLLSGLFVTTFKTGYIDPATGDAVTFDYKVPLAWLPAERRLLQIRAAFDRTIDLFREGYREIAKAVRYLVWTPKEAHERLMEFTKALRSYLARQLKALTGVDVELQVDEEYLDMWLATESLVADVELAVRLRSLAQRILGWVLYRVAYGYVTEEELRSVTDVLVKRFEFTEREAQAVFDLASVLAGIAAREAEYEYIPTLGTLASMMEYIDVPRDLIMRVFAERRVREPWASLWLRYVMTRSISSETNTMVSTFRSLLERYAIPQEIVDRVMALARQGGWTSRELEVFQVDLTLRRIRRILDTFVPTLREFISDAMYLGEWETLLADWLRARGIEAEKYKKQVEYYKKLIKSRKINRRLSWFITRLMNAYCAGVITLEEARSKLEEFKTFGLDDDEIKIILAGFQLEKAYREAIYGSPSATPVGE